MLNTLIQQCKTGYNEWFRIRRVRFNKVVLVRFYSVHSDEYAFHLPPISENEDEEDEGRKGSREERLTRAKTFRRNRRRWKREKEREQHEASFQRIHPRRNTFPLPHERRSSEPSQHYEESVDDSVVARSSNETPVFLKKIEPTWKTSESKQSKQSLIQHASPTQENTENGVPRRGTRLSVSSVRRTKRIYPQGGSLDSECTVM